MDGVVGGFALSVSGDDENCGGSFGELIEILEVVFFWIAYTREARPNLDLASFAIRMTYSSAVPVCEP